MPASARRDPSDRVRVSIAGDRVRALREERDWPQLELACRAGMAQSALSQIERGHQTTVERRTLHRLAAALDVEPGRLAGT